MLFSQTDQPFCKTNFQFNQHFHLEAAEGLVETREVKVIPIALHIVTDNNGEGNEMSPELFLQWLDSLNQQLSTIKLQAELCVINVVRDDDNVNPLIDFSSLLIDSLHESGHVNIFMPNTVGGIGAEGFSSIIGGVFTDDDFLFILGQGATYGLIAHELGHFFGLYHTFESEFGEELVNGTNCNIAGDLLCDTPADHGIQRNDVDSVNCTWLFPSSVFDANNEPFDPSTTNFMSYSQLHCINEFSPQQLQVIRNTYDLNIDYFKSCQVVSSNKDFSDLPFNINIYPNPVQDILNVDIDGIDLSFQVALFDCLGRLILNIDIGVPQINTSDLDTGLYYLKISSSDFLHTEKILIE